MRFKADSRALICALFFKNIFDYKKNGLYSLPQFVTMNQRTFEELARNMAEKKHNGKHFSILNILNVVAIEKLTETIPQIMSNLK